MNVIAGYRRFFYLVSPNETSFERVGDVPNYVNEAFPLFVSMVLVEIILLFLQGKKLPRANDGLSSLSAGLLSLLHSVLFYPVELSTYLWAYHKCNIVALPWDSSWTWMLCMVGVDFVYYWIHRAGHEMNIFWAAHQTHHSSEEYNLTTALRQSALQKYFSWLFYLPLSLFIPPSVFLVHSQVNLLYQFWVHTETVSTVGPLEYIICTPSHHRVHHGRNPYCIDKNYGGVLIIWDRLFGTFEAERKGEKIAYGLVHPLNSWNPLYAQVCHICHITSQFLKLEGIRNKLSVIFKGPGWNPGTPRLGLKEDIPQINFPVTKYDSDIQFWKAIYVWIHFTLSTVFYLVLSTELLNLPVVWQTGGVVLIIVSVISFGMLYDNCLCSTKLELLRCLMSVYYIVCIQNSLEIYSPYAFHFVLSVFLLSTLIFVVLLLNNTIPFRPEYVHDKKI